MVSNLSPTPSFPFVKDVLKSHLYHLPIFLVAVCSVVLTGYSCSSIRLLLVKVASSSGLWSDRVDVSSFILTFHRCIGYRSMLFLPGDLKNYFAKFLKIHVGLWWGATYLQYWNIDIMSLHVFKDVLWYPSKFLNLFVRLTSAIKGH